nr:di-heme oxidoredictase family protein [Leptospira perolatii]
MRKKESFFPKSFIPQIAISCLFILLGFAGCTEKPNDNKELYLAALAISNADPGEAFSGGRTTVFDVTSTAFDFPASNLREGASIHFQGGNAFFNRDWVPEGNSASAGLGPTFNTNSCRGCHSKDGRGAPPASGSLDNSPGILIRLSKVSATNPTTGGPVGLDDYGLQLNHKSIAGTPAEGSATLGTSGTIVRTYADSSTVTLNIPDYTFSWNFTAPASYAFSPRTAPMIPGLGLLEAIPEETILSWADPNDSDGDGISGKTNLVWDAKASKKVLGRFGWKANEPSLAQQNQGAFLGDIGMTSPLFPLDNCPASQSACITASGGTHEPEINSETAEAVIFYTKLVAVPGRRNVNDADVIKGKEIFGNIGCANCHKPYVQTGFVDGFPELSFQHIKPYTDLLLHDMGPNLADNRPDFQASGSEWRTPPLWGLGLIQTVNGHNRLMHDGRANGPEEAILWHGGEADTARTKFQALTADDRQSILTFLNSL